MTRQFVNRHCALSLPTLLLLPLSLTVTAFAAPAPAPAPAPASATATMPATVAARPQGAPPAGLAALTAGLPPARLQPANAVESTRKLGSGVTLVTRIDRLAPRVAFSLLVRAGAADERPQSAGWRRVLTNAMLRASLNQLAGVSQTPASPPPAAQPGGAPAVPAAPAVLTGTQLQRLAEAIGGQLGASVNDDVIEFWATGDSRNAAALLGLLLDVVQHPRLSDADVTAAVRRVGLETAAEAEDIAATATSTLRAQIYRDNGGRPLAYGLPRSTPESLRALTPDAIRSYYHRYFQPQLFTVGAAGDIDSAAVETRLAGLTASTAFVAAAARHMVPTIAPAPQFHPADKTDPPLIVKQLPTPDAWVFISFLAPKSNAADSRALSVLAAALASTQYARLPRRLLGKMPTLGGQPHGDSALQASLTLVPRHYGSEFVLFAQTGASNIEEVKNALLDELAKLRTADLTDDELVAARHYVQGTFAVDREGLRERAFGAALAPATNAPSDLSWVQGVARVSKADVRRVAAGFSRHYAVGLIMPQG